MPNLKQLLEELEELQVQPKDIKLTSQDYDGYIADAEDQADEDDK